MGKLRRSYRNAMTQLKVAIVAVVVIAGAIVLMAASQYLWLIPTAVLLFFCLKLLFRFLFTPKRYVNDNGYVVLSASNELEHRYIAKQLLGRDLKANEVVHHINGKKTDNKVRNLCLMDGEKHEIFHSWLSWKRNKSGRYPTFRDQKGLLEEEYGGTLLENLSAPKKMFTPAIAVKRSDSDFSISNRSEANQSAFKPDAISQEVTHFVRNEIKATKEKQDPELQKKLFVELRNERKRLSEERKIPAYLVFHDKTLIEMSETMPDSKHAMLEISDLGKEKYEEYGGQFIAVIRKFKNDFDIDRRKKDPA